MQDMWSVACEELYYSTKCERAIKIFMSLGGTGSRVQHRSLPARLLQRSAVWSAVSDHWWTAASWEQSRVQSCLSAWRPYWRRTSVAVTLHGFRWNTYKTAVLTHKVMTTSRPSCLIGMIHIVSPARTLRPASAPQRTRTELARRAFTVAAAVPWVSE